MGFFIDLVISCLVAFFATFGFSVLFSAPKKEWFFCGLSGTIGWAVYDTLQIFGMHYVAAMVLATFSLSVTSRILAVLRKQPGTVYLVTGIFALVPGAGLYYTTYYAMTGQMNLASAKGEETIFMAVSIVVGILFSFALPQKLFNLLRRS